MFDSQGCIRTITVEKIHVYEKKNLQKRQIYLIATVTEGV